MTPTFLLGCTITRKFFPTSICLIAGTITMSRSISIFSACLGLDNKVRYLDINKRGERIIHKLSFKHLTQIRLFNFHIYNIGQSRQVRCLLTTKLFFKIFLKLSNNKNEKFGIHIKKEKIKNYNNKKTHKHSPVTHSPVYNLNTYVFKSVTI